MRKVYLVSYDLNQPGQDYDSLIAAIRSYNGYCQALKSQWFICSDKTAKQICEHLVQYIDENDWLIVCELSSNFRAWLSDEAVKWLEQVQRS